MNIFLETPRLILRQLTEKDVDNLVAVDREPEVMQYINGGIPSSYKAIANSFLPYAMSYYERSKIWGFWAIITKSNDEFIGWIFLRPESDFELLQHLNLAESDATELGYRLRKISWNQGYTTEAAQGLIKKSFTESNIAKITAWALTENRASLRVMEKAGLQRQHEYVVSADMLNNSNLLKSSLVQNLLDRTIVKYQLNRSD